MIKAVIEANAKAGKYRTTCAPFGYTKGDDPNHLPVIDPDAAPIVRNIFEMRASGISPHHIADKLNEDGVPIPSDYYYTKLGKPNPRRTRHMWSPETVRQILHNYTYLGHLVQLRTRTDSYKNHKVIKNDEEDMIVVKNTHEAIVSQELWDRVREMEQSVSQGKRNSSGYVANPSGLIYCQDCGNKVRLAWNNTTNGSKKKPRKYLRHNYNCTSYMKFGKRYCPRREDHRCYPGLSAGAWLDCGRAGRQENRSGVGRRINGNRPGGQSSEAVFCWVQGF